MKAATLYLQNGLSLQGYSFGHDQALDGEVVFNTSMVGYTESLTDPSYSGQILCITYPLVGNYGVPDDLFENGISTHFESDKIHVRGVVISDYSFNYSHWNAVKSLDQWLKEHKIPGIYGVDTRALTQMLRDQGSMLGAIVPEGCTKPEKYYDPASESQIAIVSCKEIIRYGNPDGKKVVLVDCGVKNNIIRCLLRSADIEIIRVPWDYDFNTLEYDGLFISNGPGDPNFCDVTVKHIRKAMDLGKPIFGICMGNQLLAKAAGAKIYKMKYGHRGHTQPVRLEGSNRCFITSQNHGYAVDTSTLGPEWRNYFVNLNDGTSEGIIHSNGRFFSAQFHPEASSGPTDTQFLIDNFVDML